MRCTTVNFGRGHNTGLGWSDPTFGGLEPPKDLVGSLQPSVSRIARAHLRRSQKGGYMSVINKPPQIVERKYQLEDLVADAAEQYAGWIGSTPDHVVNSAVKMMLWRDKGFLAWRKAQDPRRGGPSSPKPGAKA